MLIDKDSNYITKHPINDKSILENVWYSTLKQNVSDEELEIYVLTHDEYNEHEMALHLLESTVQDNLYSEMIDYVREILGKET